MRPDFIFVHEIGGEAKASVVDPHGHHLEDSPVKLQALAVLAEEHGGSFHRIEALSKVCGVMRVLNLQDADVRSAVKSGSRSADGFCNSHPAVDY